MEYTNLIYGLRDPRNDVYRYIGKTTVGKRRPLSHLVQSHNALVNEWVAELKRVNLQPFVDIIENDIPLEELAAREKHHIACYQAIYGQLFNGGSSVHECISSPSIFDNTEIENTIKTLSNLNELYKIIKISTGFGDDMIASMLNVGRKTVFRVKKSEETITMKTVLKLILFSKYTMNDIFDFYMDKSNEFKGNWPDNYKEFIEKCYSDNKFLSIWCDKFYEHTIQMGKVTYNKRAKKNYRTLHSHIL
jgi:hypothetical protein